MSKENLAGRPDSKVSLPPISKPEVIIENESNDAVIIHARQHLEHCIKMEAEAYVQSKYGSTQNREMHYFSLMDVIAARKALERAEQYKKTSIDSLK